MPGLGKHILDMLRLEASTLLHIASAGFWEEVINCGNPTFG
jgi:hypothetical protein